MKTKEDLSQTILGITFGLALIGNMVGLAVLAFILLGALAPTMSVFDEPTYIGSSGGCSGIGCD